MPTAYVAREDLAPGLRVRAHQRYLIFFRIVPAGMRIERIAHSAGDPTALDFDA